VNDAQRNAHVSAALKNAGIDAMWDHMQLSQLALTAIHSWFMEDLVSHQRLTLEDLVEYYDKLLACPRSAKIAGTAAFMSRMGVSVNAIVAGFTDPFWGPSGFIGGACFKPASSDGAKRAAA